MGDVMRQARRAVEAPHDLDRIERLRHRGITGAMDLHAEPVLLALAEPADQVGHRHHGGAAEAAAADWIGQVGFVKCCGLEARHAVEEELYEIRLHMPAAKLLADSDQL